MRSWSWSLGAASIVAICVAASVAGGSTVACSSFTSEDSEVGPDAGNAADACDDGGCISLDGCAEKILYVSAEGGNDANTGCDRLLPKKTLGSAVSTLVLLNRNDFEVHACKGDYRENGLSLTVPVKLLGGYECSTGKRLPDYGYPKFSTLNESVLSVTDTGTVSAALTIGAFAPGVTGAIVVDGFRIRAPSRPNVTTAAVRLTAGAAATISNDAVEGASDGAMTLGMELTDTGPVRVEGSIVYGGAGEAPAGGEAVGSVGLLSLRSGPLTIHESSIHGGTGTSPVNAGSVGLVLVGVEKPAKVTKSLLYGGSGTGSGSSSKAVATFGADLDLEGNLVHGGDAKCSAAGCRTTGIELAGGKNRIAGNSVFGGNLPATATGALTFFGVHVNSAVASELTNNFILGGNSNGISPSAVSSSVGVRIFAGSGALVRQNTILTGKSGTTLSTSAITVTGAHTDAVIESNLFVGLRAASNEVGVTTSCATISSLANNGFFDLSVLASGYVNSATNAACATPFGRTTLDGLTMLANSAVDNRRVAPTCSGEPGCFAPLGCETTAASCRAAVFADFDESKLGASSFIGEKPGLHLGTGACDFTNGGKAGVPTDFFGSVRTPPTSFGAHEQDICAK